MTEFTRIAVDTSKHVFTLHGTDREGRAVLRRNLRRAAFLEFFAKLPPTQVALEACGGSHHWGRELQALGHEVMLIPPQGACPRAGQAGPVGQAVRQARQERQERRRGDLHRGRAAGHGAGAGQVG